MNNDIRWCPKEDVQSGWWDHDHAASNPGFNAACKRLDATQLNVRRDWFSMLMLYWALSSVVFLLFDPADDLVQEFQAVTTESYFHTSIVEDLARFAASLALKCQAITIHCMSDGFIC